MKALLFLTATILLFGAGYWLGQKTSVDPVATNASSKARSTVAFPERSKGNNPNSIEERSNLNGAVSLAEILAEPSVFELLRTAHIGLANMSADEVQMLALDAAESDIGTLKFTIIAVCLRRLTEIDPVSTLKFVESNALLPDQQLLGPIMSNWLYLDAAAAVQYVIDMKDGGLKMQFARRMIGEPKLAAAGLTHELDHILGSDAEGFRVAKQINTTTPAEAYAIALNIQDQRSRRQLLPNAVRRWAAEDPIAALRQVERLTDDNLRVSLLGEAYRHYIELDPNAAIAYIEQFQNDEALTQRLLSIAADQAPLQALPLVEAFTRRTDNDHILRNLLSSWAQTEPHQAIAYIDGLPEQDRLRHYQSVYSTYVRNQPEQAIDWVVSRFDENPIVAGMALQQSVSSNSIDYALHILETTNNPGVRASLLPSIATHKATVDQEAAIRWLQSYRNETSYEPAMLRIIGMMAGSAPDKAAAVIAPIMHNESAAQQVSSIASHWYQKDPAAAMGWVDQLTNRTAKDSALTTFIHHTYNKDPDLAASYLKEIQTPFKREDASVIVAIGYLQHSNMTTGEIIDELNLTANAAAKVNATASQVRSARYFN